MSRPKGFVQTSLASAGAVYLITHRLGDTSGAFLLRWNYQLQKKIIDNDKNTEVYILPNPMGVKSMDIIIKNNRKLLAGSAKND